MVQMEIVIGAMKPDGTLNLEQMKEFIEEAKGMPVTLHRAFDMCKDPFVTLEEAKELGISTILTSGQKNTCVDGMELLKELVEKAQGETEILVGGGVDASVLPMLAEKTKSKSLSYVRENFYGKRNALPETGCEYGYCICKRI